MKHNRIAFVSCLLKWYNASNDSEVWRVALKYCRGDYEYFRPRKLRFGHRDRFRVTFATQGAGYDGEPYHVDLDNEKALERFLEQIDRDEAWKNIPRSIATIDIPRGIAQV